MNKLQGQQGADRKIPLKKQRKIMMFFSYSSAPPLFFAIISPKRTIEVIIIRTDDIVDAIGQFLVSVR